MERREAKNVMVSMMITALTLGTMGFVFMEPGNPYQQGALVLVTIVFMAFYAFKYMRISHREKLAEKKRKELIHKSE